MTLLQAIFIIFIYIIALTSEHKKCSLVILFTHLIYFIFIIDLNASLYYSLTALINLIAGLLIHKKNRSAAICSYSLTLCCPLGYLLWFWYFPPSIYDNISLSILALQIITILPWGLKNGLRNTIQHSLAKSAFFDSCQTRVTMYKSQATKETKKWKKKQSI